MSLTKQRRIVAKVDPLMTLVDPLETQLAASRTTAANLLEAIVAELTTATAEAFRTRHAGRRLTVIRWLADKLTRGCLKVKRR